MPEDEFWALIDTMGGRADENGLEALAEALSSRSKRDVRAFQERLAHVLFDLDRYALAVRPVRFDDDPDDAEPIPLSDDTFLYLRAGIVTQGRGVVAAVLARPELLDEGTWPECEDLLYVAEEIIEDDIETKVSYETGSNEAHWPPQGARPPDEIGPARCCLAWVVDLSEPIASSRHFPDGRVEEFVSHLPPDWLPRATHEQVGRAVDALVSGHGGLPDDLATPLLVLRIEVGEEERLTPWLTREPDDLDAFDVPVLVARVRLPEAALRPLADPARRVLLEGLAARCALAALPADHGARPGLEALDAAAAPHLPGAPA